MIETKTRHSDEDTSRSIDSRAGGGVGSQQITGHAERDDIGEEYLAEAVVRLIRNNKAVRQAILDFAASCSNIKTEL